MDQTLFVQCASCKVLCNNLRELAEHYTGQHESEEPEGRWVILGEDGIMRYLDTGKPVED